ncbi:MULTISPECIES: hypothetical protein [Microbacterium]|uniref:hypothetical protein n=1 Tax=Microbacterium TaxID=33882 RepID=UPI00217DC453|nr:MULTISPECIES: hypothetical protein [Microbacterium]
MAAVLPLDGDPVLEQLLHLRDGEQRRRLCLDVLAAVLDATADVAAHMLQEQGGDRLEGALDVRLVGRGVRSRGDERDAERLAGRTEVGGQVVLAPVGRDRLREDERLSVPQTLVALLFDQCLFGPRGRDQPSGLPCTLGATGVGHERTREHDDEVHALGRLRAQHRREHRSGGDVDHDRQVGPADGLVVDPDHDVQRRRVDLHLLARPQGDPADEIAPRLKRERLAGLGGAEGVAATVLGVDQPVERGAARHRHLVAVAVAHPPGDVRDEDRAADGGALRARREHLAEDLDDTRIDGARRRA